MYSIHGIIIDTKENLNARKLSITQPTSFQLPELRKFVVDQPVCTCSTYSCLVDLLFGVYKAKAAMASAITPAAKKLDDVAAAFPSNSGRVLFERRAPVVAAAIPAVALAWPVVVG
jgi:hypothetical protein